MFSRSRTLVEKLADLSLEQLMTIEVSSTSFFDIPPEKAPGSIYLISNETIDISYAASLADLLAYYVPGMHISNAYSAGPLVSSRGIASPANATILFMLDGNPLNVGNGSGINANLDLPLLGYVDRVEVLKGPCSIIHGSGSINGFVNVIQKNGKDHPGGFLSIEAGFPHDLYKAETGYGWSSRKWGDIYLYSGVVTSKGIDENGVKLNSLPDINNRFSLNWQRGAFRLSGFFQNEESDSTLRWGGSGIAEEESVSMESAGIFPELDISLTETEVLTVGVPIRYDSYNPDFLYLETEYGVEAVTDLDSEWGIRPNLLLKTTRFAKHRVALGGAFAFKRFNSDAAFLDANAISIDEDWSTDAFSEEGQDTLDRIASDVDMEWFETSLFFEDNYQLTDTILFFAGIRYDEIETDHVEVSLKGSDEAGEKIEVDELSLNRLTPRLGVSWQMSENQTMKLIYQEGYHFPSYINSLLYKNGGDNVPLSIEDVRSYEFGYQLTLLEDRCRLSLDLYYNRFEDIVSIIISDGFGADDEAGTQDLSDWIAQKVVDESSAAGFEVGLRYTPDDRSRYEISYAYTRPDFSEDGGYLSGITDVSGDHWTAFPEHTVKLNMSQRLLDDKLDLSLGVLYNAGIATTGDVYNEIESSVVEGNGVEDPFDHNRFVVNAALGYRLSENWSVVLKGENIFNNDVPATGYYYYTMSRQQLSIEEPLYTIGVSWKF